MNSGKQFGIRGSETIGSGITKVSDDVLVYMDKGKLVVETRHNPLLAPVGPIGCIFIPMFFLLFWFFLFLLFRSLSPVNFAIAFIIMIVLAAISIRRLPKNVDRTTIDINKGLVRFEEERGKKSKLRKQCSTSSIKNVKVVVGDYGRMDVYLESTNESFYIVGEGELIGSAEKLQLAHRIAEFLGVPVIERT